ncbi:hypothetical protein V1520DRAFT_279857 [Lipomyces starkeyi]|uniref:Reverse transcriptase/retrotransposon-derived protein RNase H-like domain-containing protein n=1 Tax=Lipomyces starkeyi NRRL Y-11557 TaxID=675824 RepID=A0A1E3Q063_LIPST|nr:hypothetical protein LIPSTDRAFT_64831 [Lipomyces starkeyi NRRL Y-11557]
MGVGLVLKYQKFWILNFGFDQFSSKLPSCSLVEAYLYGVKYNEICTTRVVFALSHIKGHNGGKSGLSVNDDKQFSSGWPRQNYKATARICECCRQLIPGYSEKLQVLAPLLKKKIKFDGPQKSTTGSNTSKRRLTTPAIKHFHLTNETILETDASGTTIAAILSRRDESHEFPTQSHSKIAPPGLQEDNKGASFYLKDASQRPELRRVLGAEVYIRELEATQTMHDDTPVYIDPNNIESDCQFFRKYFLPYRPIFTETRNKVLPSCLLKGGAPV